MTADTHPVEREELMAYLDGELAANEAARVAAHLTDCAECRQLEADLRSVSAQMLTWNVEPAPSQITENVVGLLQAKPPQGSVKEAHDAAIELMFGRRMRIGRWILAAACLGVAAMILVKVFAPAPSKQLDLSELVTSRISRPSVDQKATVSSAPAGGGAGGQRDETKIERQRPMPQP